MSITKKPYLLRNRAALLVSAGVVILIAAVAVILIASNAGSEGPVAGPIINSSEGYHVIVAGGEPEGVAAALAAARNGMKTLLVEDDSALGGLMTLGMLNSLDQNYGPDGELLTRGIYQEFYKALGDAFEIEDTKKWFLKKCDDEPNITVMLDTEIIAPVMEGNRIVGLEIKKKGDSASRIVRSLAVIDATVDGDICAAAGVPYTVGGDDYGAHGTMQGVTLVFELAGVKWDSVYDYLMNDGLSSTGANKSVAWGYGTIAREYTLQDSNMRFRGPNIARQKNGNVLLNALIIFGVDALDPESYAEGIERGDREIPHIVEFMRENFPGFENASYVRHADQLYVRETRHIVGEYRLTITDVLENRDHWDRIGHGSYAVDIHASSPDNSGNIIGQPDIYSIPFRCLVPLEIDQLLIAGRSASYDSIPHGSTRVMPVGMVTGEACGTAVAYSITHNVTFRQMTRDANAVLWLQNQLKSKGAYLVEYDPPRPAVMDHWAYSGVAVMRELGMAAGGYSNDYKLDDDITNRWALQTRINGMMRVINERTEDRGQLQIPVVSVSLQAEDITVGDLFVSAAKCASLGEDFSEAVDAQTYLIKQEILDTGDLEHFPDLDAVMTNGQLLYVLGKLYMALMG